MQRAREEAEEPGAGAGGGGGGGGTYASLTQDDVLLALGFVAQILARSMYTASVLLMRPPRAPCMPPGLRARPDDDEAALRGRGLTLTP